MKIGFIGLGIMGKPMAKNLLRHGYSLTVYDLCRPAVDEVVSAGAVAASSCCEAARECDIVITMLPNSPNVMDAVFGENGACSGMKDHALLIDMSSINPMASREIHARLKDRNLRMLDAPVSGGEPKAVDGTLSIMVGGSEEDFHEAAGCQYVELPLAQMMALNREHFRELLSFFRQQALPCGSCNNFLPSSLRLTGPEPTPRQQLWESMQQAVDRAGELGAKVIVFGSAGAKNVPDGFPYEDALRQIAECFHLAADAVQGSGIRIAIEPICFLESNILRTVEEGYRFWKTVSRPQVGLLADYYHMSVEREPLSCLKESAPALCHLHFADPVGRRYPSGEREAEYADFFRTLQEIGYGGNVSLEAFAMDFSREIAPALQCMMKLANEI